jgi:phage-related protein
MGLVKELEVCEQHEEILNNNRIMEEQERKLLLEVQDMIKKINLETQLRYQKQMGKNF